MLKEAVEYVRQRRGPALVHAKVTRPYSHSLSDDEKLYKTSEEREEEAHRDPLSKFSLFLVREGLIDQKEIEHLEAEVDREVRDATDQALAAESPCHRFDSRECLFARYRSDFLRVRGRAAARMARPRPWWKWLRRRCWMKCHATSESPSSAKTSPMPAGKKISST